MAIDTKPNFSCRKFEQCSNDIMNLSGCTQIYGYFDLESGSTLTICDNAGTGKVLTSDTSGVATWQDSAAGGITSLSGGSGMDFSPITSTGSVVLGTPSTITSGSTDSVGATTHNHCFDAQTFVTGTQGILADGNNRFYLDDVYITNETLVNLYTYTGVTANQSLGVLPSGQTLGMVYITNSGTSTANVNLGTTPTGNDITPFQAIEVAPDEDVSVTINMRLSQNENKTIYINSTGWTGVELKVQWANITYQNASTTINPGDLPIASQTTLGAIRVGDGLDIDNDGILSVTGGSGAGTITGGTNGLGESGADVCLGGTLLNNTEFDGTASNYHLCYASDHSSAFGARSIPDVAYVTGLTSGSITGATNLGTGDGTLYTSISDKNLQFKTLSGGSSIGITCDANYVGISVTGGSGGFLGTISETSTEPANLQDNQWVKPAPTTTGDFNYVFTNFSDSGNTAIQVNLSLEDVYLRYCSTGSSSGYWIKESYDKPLSSGYTWIGDSSSAVSEIPVINEWVGSESLIQYTGQKFAYPTQTVFQVDIGTCVTMPNKIFCENVPLCIVGDTTLFSIPASKTALISSAKLVMRQDASPDSFTVSLGNNSCTTPSLSYNNMVSNCTIDDVLNNEVYDLLSPTVPTCAVACDGSCLGEEVKIRVQSGSTGILCAHVLVEGYVF